MKTTRVLLLLLLLLFHPFRHINSSLRRRCLDRGRDRNNESKSPRRRRSRSNKRTLATSSDDDNARDRDRERDRDRDRDHDRDRDRDRGDSISSKAKKRKTNGGNKTDDKEEEENSERHHDHGNREEIERNKMQSTAVNANTATNCSNTKRSKSSDKFHGDEKENKDNNVAQDKKKGHIEETTSDGEDHEKASYTKSLEKNNSGNGEKSKSTYLFSANYITHNDMAMVNGSERKEGVGADKKKSSNDDKYAEKTIVAITQLEVDDKGERREGKKKNVNISDIITKTATTTDTSSKKSGLRKLSIPSSSKRDDKDKDKNDGKKVSGGNDSPKKMKREERHISDDDIDDRNSTSTNGKGGHKSHSSRRTDDRNNTTPLRRNSNYIKLTCIHCHTKCFTFKDYYYHLSSRTHKAALRQIAIRQRAHLLQLRARQRTTQRELEEKSKETYESKFCHLCRLHYRQPKAKHQLSEHHKTMKKFLMPYCSICHLAFKSPMLYETHRCSLEHIKNKARKQESDTEHSVVDYNDDDDDGMREIDLNKFMTVDSVGEIDEAIDDDVDALLNDGHNNSESGHHDDDDDDDDDLIGSGERTPLGIEYVKEITAL